MLEASAAAVIWDMGWGEAVMPLKSDMEIRETTVRKSSVRESISG